MLHHPTAPSNSASVVCIVQKKNMVVREMEQTLSSKVSRSGVGSNPNEPLLLEDIGWCHHP